jgi:hypothetical protein
MSRNPGNPRQASTKSLKQAASTIFVLTTLLPFLIFVWIIYSLNAMQNLRVQIGLALALLVSILGFTVLRNVMAHTSEVLQLLMRAESRDVATAPRGPVASSRAGATVAGNPVPLVSAATSGRSTPPRESEPAIGTIRELQDATTVVAHLWRRHAEPLIGLPILVSLSNVDEPDTGTLSRITDDGLVLQRDGAEFGVLWRLITAIETAPEDHLGSTTG